MHRDLARALELADLAASLALPRFRALDLRVETKPDLTPVTEADRAVERAPREGVEGEAVLGEEEGGPGPGGRRWILDPIDGTKNYARGIPAWFTLIALEVDGEVEIGVASAPALGRRWWAVRGDGAFADGDPVRVSRVARLEEAAVSATHSVRHVAERAWHRQQFSDAWAHLLVAEGSLDAAVDPVLHPWDIAALKVIVEEAGGHATDFSGAAGIEGGSLVSSNGLLHGELLGLLGRKGRSAGPERL
jgi:histidinol-phosphatase